MIVYPPQKMDSKESNILSSSIGLSSENKSNKFILNMVLTHIKNRCDEIKNQSHLISIAITPTEHIYLMLCHIILKYCLILLIHLLKFISNQLSSNVLYMFVLHLQY